jgi:hypothetical protein
MKILTEEEVLLAGLLQVLQTCQYKDMPVKGGSSTLPRNLKTRTGLTNLHPVGTQKRQISVASGRPKRFRTHCVLAVKPCKTVSCI